MTAEIKLTKQARLGQLADELSARLGKDVSVWARHDDDGNPTAVAAEIDEQTLRETVDEHVPTWPEVWRSPVEAFDKALQDAKSAAELVQALRMHLIPILSDLERRR